MPKIHHAEYAQRTRVEQLDDGAGGVTTREHIENVVHSVTFDDYLGIPHTLTFYAPGTQVGKDAEGSPRIVGEGVELAHHYTDHRAAVQAYLAGEL